jgi:hypothetical protein
MMAFLAHIARLLVGVLLCLTPLTAFIVVGWSHRVMQRRALRHWVSKFAKLDFQSYVSGQPSLTHLVRPPNFLVTQSARGHNILGNLTRLRFRSLISNFALGFQGVLNIALVTFPIGALWLLSWWGGWENSFNKGYEQAWVGPTVAFVGIGLFIPIMVFMPIAQAHQAVSGERQRFFDFKVLLPLLRRSPASLVALATAYGLAGAVIAIFHAGPLGLINGLTDIDPSLFSAAVETSARRFVFATAFLAFTLYMLLRLFAGSIYARGIAKLVQKGVIAMDDLPQFHRQAFEQLGIAASTAAPSNWSLGALMVWLLAAPALAALWFGFVAELYISQFFNHYWHGWMLHPLVQLPWFNPVTLS